jgi:hypothetical protein
LTAQGRLPGTDLAVHYEQRFNVVTDGKELGLSLSMPIGKVEDLVPLLAHFPALAGIGGSGRIGFWATVAGQGEDRRWKGRLELEDVFLEHEKIGLRLEGLTGVLDWTFAGGEFRTEPGQIVALEGWNWGDVTGQRARFEFEMVSASEWRFGPLTVDMAGGQLRAGQVSLDPAAPDFMVGLTVEGICLKEGFQMAPELEIEGEGLVDGQVGVRYRRGRVELEGGVLGLRAEVPARLRLAPQAWFTEGMSPQNPKFKNMQTIERALEDLELHDLRVEILSEQPPGLPLRVVVAGRPLMDGIDARAVRLTLQVHGPVAELGSWLLQPEVRMGKAPNRLGE